MPHGTDPRHPHHRARGAGRSRPGRPAGTVHRPAADTAVLATQWRLEVTVSFDHGGSGRPFTLPEC